MCKIQGPPDEQTSTTCRSVAFEWLSREPRTVGSQVKVVQVWVSLENNDCDQDFHVIRLPRLYSLMSRWMQKFGRWTPHLHYEHARMYIYIYMYTYTDTQLDKLVFGCVCGYTYTYLTCMWIFVMAYTHYL